MRLSAKIAYNTVIQISSKLISTLLGLIAVAIIARYLGKAGFGQYTTIITFLSFFGIIADLGLTLVTVQMISRPGANKSLILNNLFSLRLVSALLFLSLAPLVILAFPYEPLIKTGVALATFSFFFTALNQIIVGLFQQELKMDRVSFSEVASRLMLVAGVIAAVKLKSGLLGIIVAMVAASGVNFALHFLFSRQFVKLRLAFNIKIYKEIINKSWPLAITIVLNLIYLKTDTLILSLIKSQAEVGIYGAAYKVVDVLITIPFMFAGLILPLLTKSWEEKNRKSFKEILQKSFDFMVILALPLLIGAQFTSKELMEIIAGDKFSASGDALKILIAATAAIFTGIMFSHAIIAINKQKKIINAYLFTSITAVVGYLIFIPKYSYFGAAWITVYSEAIIALAAGYYVWKYTKFLPSLRVAGKALLASLIMALALYKIPDQFYQPNLSLLTILSSAALIYFISLYLLKGISKQDLLNLLNK